MNHTKNKQRHLRGMPNKFMGKEPKPERPYKPTPDPVYAWKLHLRAAKVRELVAKKNANRYAALLQSEKIVHSNPLPFDAKNVQIFALKRRYS